MIDGEMTVPPGADDDQMRRNSDAVDAELGRQRRQNVRVDVKYPVTISIGNIHDVMLRTRDISATGCGFSTRLPMEIDMVGDLRLEFPDWDFRKGFVVRFVKPILAGTQVGVQFIDLTEDERERLVKEVFDVQREQLQSRR